MSTPNSHNNSPSSSSENDESEVSTEQRAIALLPQAYPFKLTEDYQAAFDSDDPAVVLPSYYRLAMWQKYVGDPHWQRVQEETAEYNRRVEEEFTHELAEIETDNQQRSDRNRAKKLAYANQLKRYHADKKDYDRKVESAREKARENVIKQLHKELDNAIEQQSELIDLAFEDAVDNALSQPKMKGESNIVWWVLVVLTIAGLATFPTVFGPSIYGFLAYRAAVYKRKQCPEELIHVVNHYESSYHETRYKFLLHQPRTHRFGPRCVYSPACIFADSQGEKEERNPLGKHKVEDYEEPYDILNNIVAFVPLVGCALAFKALPSKNYLMTIARRLGSYEFKQQRRKKMHVVLDDSLKHADDNSWQAVDEWIKEYLNHNNPIPNEPDEPIRPKEEPLRTLPSPPTLKIAVPLEPPADCFDTAEQGLVEYVFKGSQVFGAEQVRTLARTRLFSGDQVHPHFTFGGVPFPITGTSPHMLVIGNSGSGKTTTMLRLMSSLLPLSTSQAKRLANRLSNGAEVYPESLHQWGRSRTHQAVVYNAKGEYVRYLEAFGFDSEVDLFNLDPVAPNGFAWDVAADIDDRESIKKFAEQLIPKSVKASQDASTEFWYGTARGVLEAIIVSLRNAALTQDKEPSWTLRDLVKIAKNNNYMKHVLMWHDTPLEAVEEFFSDAAQQTSSVMMTLRQCMRLYDGVAERWYHAKNCGRAISLKKWSLQGRHSLLVLPNTMENVASYGPLNKAVMKALAGLWLNEAYSLYFDESGTQHKRHRYLFLDEFGQAGQFDELERLMAEGRSFGVHVVLGLQQLSQVREAYGENGSETIVGLCPYKACMRSNDTRTQEWMSKLVGNCLRSYNKSSFTYSTSNGVTITQSSSQSEGGGTGTNQSSSHSETEVKSDTIGSSATHSDSKNQSTTMSLKPGEKGTSTRGTGESDSETTNRSHTESDSTTDGTTFGTSAQTNWSNQAGQSQASNTNQNKGGSTTTELRGEPAIETYEFANFPDPETTGNCEGVYITPTLPVFRTTLQMAQVQPEFESPEKLKQPILRRSKKEEEKVSRPTQWNDQDLERLFLDKPHTQLNAPYMQTVLDNPPVFEQAGGSKVEQPLLEHLDDEEPLADFQFE